MLGCSILENVLGQIEDLRMFALVVESRSISLAAKKMRIAKSAVSRRLSLLEERYGSRLIDRNPGVWEITATGLELYQRAASVVNDADEIENDFTEAARNLAGPLKVSVPRDFGLAFLNSALIAFKQRHPEIQLMVDFDDRTVDLSRENYDFAIRITPKLEPNVVAKQIGVSRHQLCASLTYLNTNGFPERLSELQNHSILHFGAARRAEWEFIDETGKHERVEFQPSLNSNSGEFLLNATIDGLGIANMPDFICAPAIAAGELVPILPKLVVDEWGIFLLHAEDRRLNRRMRLFSDEMEFACLPHGTEATGITR
jgi:DNA-binding transcriptional LysR family regulator